jgi:hypothetical protein
MGDRWLNDGVRGRRGKRPAGRPPLLRAVRVAARDRGGRHPGPDVREDRRHRPQRVVSTRDGAVRHPGEGPGSRPCPALSSSTGSAHLASQRGAECRAACAINRLSSGVALPKRSRIVEYRGFWRSLGKPVKRTISTCYRKVWANRASLIFNVFQRDDPQTHWAEHQAVRSVGHAGAEDDRRSEAKRHDNPGAQQSHSRPVLTFNHGSPYLGSD